MLHMRQPIDAAKTRIMWRTQTKGEAVVPARLARCRFDVDRALETNDIPKVWSITDDAEATITSVLSALDLHASEPRMLTFGTTIVTNAIIQRQFARVALITTAGFGDVLDIARGNRRRIYDIATPPREPSPVPRELCFEIDARLSADGSISRDLDAASPLAISFDMGGTTTDVCLIVNGQAEVHEQA